MAWWIKYISNEIEEIKATDVGIHFLLNIIGAQQINSEALIIIDHNVKDGNLYMPNLKPIIENTLNSKHKDTVNL